MSSLLPICVEGRIPLITGTTGLSESLQADLSSAAKSIPIVAAPNFSRGVTLLFHLAKEAAARLPEFDVEIVEMHHHAKVDAPSGTALRLAEAVVEGRQRSLPLVHGRQGAVGPRQPHELGMHVLRGGDVVGEHTLLLAGAGERVELGHRATDRTIFGRGALTAAKWVIGKPPGRYDMFDVMELR